MPPTALLTTPSRGSKSAPPLRLPPELVDTILHLSASTHHSGPHKLTLLLLSPDLRQRLTPTIYRTILLTTARSLHLFASLLRSTPSLGRHVVRLWIGPLCTTSDFITLLAPPTPSEAAWLAQARAQVHASAKNVLRACRRLSDVALSGELLSFKTAETFGTACQPRALTSVNPYSFVGGFSAPIFKRVSRLRIVDANLALEEVDEIRTLANLETLEWTAPKDYGDMSRDLQLLFRLLQRPSHHYPTPLPFNFDTLPSPVPSQLDRFHHLIISTAPDRCGHIQDALHLHSSLSADQERADKRKPPSIETIPLKQIEMDEWDALRDLINQAAGAYSNLALLDGADSVDANQALVRQADAWLSSSPS
ncbi:hypothetical protein ACQY0O_005363 [Thecaphora frezii]